MPSLFDRVYAPLPLAAQEALLAGRGYFRRRLRGGALYTRLLAHLERTQWAAPEELRALQMQQLRTVLRHAVLYVPYYRDQARLLDVTADAAWGDPLAALSRFPLLTKSAVIAAGEGMIAGGANRRLLAAGYSSGTTGTPIKVYRNLYSVNVEAACLRRQWSWAGVREADRRATLRGQLIVPATATRPPFWRYNRADHQLLMSSFHLSEANVPLYIEQLQRFRPVALEGFPSSLYLLALFGRGHGVEGLHRHLKGVFTSSEMIGAHQRATIEQAFGCPIYDFFGNTERTVFVGTCEKGAYHVFPEYGWTEYLPIAGGAPAGQVRMVGTPFHNLGMPLVRYDGDDVVVPGQQGCACGRHLPTVERIIGRNEDYVVTPDGRLVARLDFAFKGLPHIVESQIVQDDVRHIAVKLVTGPDYGPHVEAELLARLCQLLGAGVEVSVEHVERIPRTSAGKFRMIVSHARRPVQSVSPVG